MANKNRARLPLLLLVLAVVIAWGVYLDNHPPQRQTTTQARTAAAQDAIPDAKKAQPKTDKTDNGINKKRIQQIANIFAAKSWQPKIIIPAPSPPPPPPKPIAKPIIVQKETSTPVHRPPPPPPKPIAKPIIVQKETPTPVRIPTPDFAYLGNLKKTGEVVAFFEDNDGNIKGITKGGNLTENYQLQAITDFNSILHYLPTQQQVTVKIQQ